MAIIRIKRGPTVPTGLTAGELAWDYMNSNLFIGATGTQIVRIAGSNSVQTFNGLSGAVSGVTTSVANVFTPVQTFNAGITTAGITVGNTRITSTNIIGGNASGFTIRGSTAGSFNHNEISFPLASSPLSISSATGVIHLDSGLSSKTVDYQTSIRFLGYNSGLGITTATNLISPGAGGNVVTLPTQSGTLLVSSEAVTRFNGLTGSVTGVTTGSANTFTALQTFNSGISASGGVTFSTPITSNAYRYSSSVFDTKTAGFTLASSDNGKIFVMNNGSNAIINIPTGLGIGFACEFLVVGGGRITLTANAGVALSMYDTAVFPVNRVQLINYTTDTFLGTYSYSNY